MELIKIEEKNVTLLEDVTSELIRIDKLEKQLKEEKNNLRSKLLEEMEKNNIKKIDMEALSITYKEQSMRETFNSKKFREDNPDLYDEYIEFSPIKSSLLIKVK